MSSTVILILGHVYDPGTRTLFEDLDQQCGRQFDVRFLADNTRGTFDRSRTDPRFATFKIGDLEALGYPGKSRLRYEADSLAKRRDRNMMMGNTELPVLWFFGRSPGYTNYWIIEYDVRYTGSWLDFFSYFADNDADLLGTSLVRYGQRPDWGWWESMDLKDSTILKENFVRGFFPVYRLSNRALARLHDYYRGGSKGHYECLVPTVLEHAGLAIEDIGGSGSFVRPENRNRFYRNSPLNHGLAPGTFVFRPIMARPGSEADMLWHPVKHRPYWKTAMTRARRRLGKLIPRA